jgi:CubicO group peptidase (beta-lactamase class C family)
MADRSFRCPTAVPGWRRRLWLLVVPILRWAATPAHRPAQAAAAAPVAQAPPVPSDQAAQIIAVVRDAMEQYSLRAVIVRVTIDGHPQVTAALGESMTGVPATTDMHFRNGAVAISYVSALLLTLVDDGVLRLDDPLSLWMPELPDANQVTLKMLANMTSGYQDYVPDEQFVRDGYLDPFRQWTPQELVAIGLAQPRLFAPGTNWDYAHTNYVILGLALERATGTSMVELLQQRVLGPIGLDNTANAFTPAIPEPALHAFSSERRVALGVPPGTRFYEESTYWNPSWTITHGAIQTTNIYDMAASAVAFGEGTLLSPASHQAMVGPNLLGFGSPLPGCRTCHTLDEVYNYRLGIVRSGNWLLQNPLFSGESGVAAYLPGKKIAIALAVTYGEGAFDEQGNYANRGDTLFREIGALLAPDDVPQVHAERRILDRGAAVPAPAGRTVPRPAAPITAPPPAPANELCAPLRWGAGRTAPSPCPAGSPSLTSGRAVFVSVRGRRQVRRSRRQ